MGKIIHYKKKLFRISLDFLKNRNMNNKIKIMEINIIPNKK